MTFEPIAKTTHIELPLATRLFPIRSRRFFATARRSRSLLPTDARTGRRLMDYIRVGTGVMRSRAGVPRDVYAEDAELTITKPRLRSNGVEQRAANSPAKVSAPVIRVDVPGQGRYDFSFRPRADQGFERAGKCRRTRWCFPWAGTFSAWIARIALPRVGNVQHLCAEGAGRGLGRFRGVHLRCFQIARLDSEYVRGTS